METATVAAEANEASGFSLPGLVAAKLRGREFLGHPVGLYVLFLTEMWERFSYYGMIALLVLYMNDYLLTDATRAHQVFGYDTLAHLITVFFSALPFFGAHFSKLSVQQMSSQIYGLYTCFVYVTPFFGGLLADKLWGQHKCVYLGGILMAIGHFLMAFERCFLFALLFLVLGCGAIKPNISTQVGNLYPQGDGRRDRAFTIFYMGINIGAVLAPFICGTLGHVVGWGYGFASAGVGMLFGLVVYYLGSGLVPRQPAKTKADLEKGIDREIQNSAAFERPVKRPLTSLEWRQIWALVILCAFNIAFWAVYMQQSNTLMLWSAQRTNWHFWIFNIPPEWYASFNPAFIIMFAPLLDIYWGWQSKRGKEPSTVYKMGIGCLLLGLSYFIMMAAAQFVPAGERGSVMWLTGTTVIFTLGELYLSPTGLSLVTKVAPGPLLNTMMGCWFFSYAVGDWISGDLGMFYNVMTKHHFFQLLAGIGIVTGFIFFLLKRPLSRSIGADI